MDSEKKQYWVYMLRCADGSLYTGSTSDLARRLAQHEAGIGARHTKKRLPVELVWTLGGIPTGRSAWAIERRLKVLRKAEKLKLITGDKKLAARVQQWFILEEEPQGKQARQVREHRTGSKHRAIPRRSHHVYVHRIRLHQQLQPLRTELGRHHGRQVHHQPSPAGL